MRRRATIQVTAALFCSALAGNVSAALLRVPSGYATIQEAIDAASAGDDIVVGRGDYCGAVVDKPVRLVGLGFPTIVGCEGGPTIVGAAKAGFFLPGSAGSSDASGTTIAGFRFDGEGVSNQNLEPLAFGVFGRFASDVRVTHNRFDGTVQAITNTAGDRWVIWQNRIENLTLFDCTSPFCAGGDGIIVQAADGRLAAPGGAENPLNRPEGNWIGGNSVSGTPPDGFDVFGMVGILVFAADDTTVISNRLSIADNPNAEAPAQGILVTNTCCGEEVPLIPGSRDTKILFNHGLGSELAVVVEGMDGENTEGLVLRHNLGTVVVEGETQVPPRWNRFRRLSRFFR